MIEFTHSLTRYDEETGNDVPHQLSVKITNWSYEAPSMYCPGGSELEYEVLENGQHFELDRWETIEVEDAAWDAIEEWKLNEKYGYHR